MSLNLSGRHYWSRGAYKKYLTLEANGDLTENETYNGNNNFSYNAFNIDLLFSWRFAPGSDLSISYKNAIEHEDTELLSHFGKNLDRTISQPQSNGISLKILYYLDYLCLRKRG